MSQSSIELMEQTYNLIPTENKRKLIYENNLMVNTKPYVINNEKIIIDD